MTFAPPVRNGHMPQSDRRAPGTERLGDWIQTYTGGRMFPMDAHADEIHIRDIAHALSMQCRYAGHCLKFYSVAEHSVHVARWVAANGGINAVTLKALLHDATEAYLVDVPRPVKPFLVGYKEAEAKLWKVIANTHGMSDEMPDLVHEADNRILWDERAQNMSPSIHEWSGAPHPIGVRLEFWSPSSAEAKFLDAYRRITQEGGL